MQRLSSSSKMSLFQMKCSGCGKPAQSVKVVELDKTWTTDKLEKWLREYYPDIPFTHAVVYADRG